MRYHYKKNVQDYSMIQESVVKVNYGNGNLWSIGIDNNDCGYPGI
jgi:hypothetical protein